MGESDRSNKIKLVVQKYMFDEALSYLPPSIAMSETQHTRGYNSHFDNTKF